MKAKKDPATKGARSAVDRFLEEESKAIDADRDAPIPDETSVTRGHGRSKTLQVRLNEDELDELERLASTRRLPTSTLAREAILQLISPSAARPAATARLVDDFRRFLDTYGDTPAVLAPEPSNVPPSDGDAARSTSTGPTADRLNRLFHALRDGQRDAPTSWSRQYRANRDKLASGDATKAAEVVHSLWLRDREAGLSTGERRMLTKARQIVASDLAATVTVDHDFAETILDAVLAGDD